jgi:hypothetical protein
LIIQPLLERKAWKKQLENEAKEDAVKKAVLDDSSEVVKVAPTGPKRTKSIFAK